MSSIKKIKPLVEIIVPEPKADETYSTTLLDREFSFFGLKKLLGVADISKSGDRVCGLAAEDEISREAARSILSELTLQHLYDRPLIDDKGQLDSVMRVGYDIDLEAFSSVATMTLGATKNHLLSSTGNEIARIGAVLIPVMVAALAKICDVHELIYLSRKVKPTAKARTRVGLPGTLSSRCQPNHPTDDLRCLTLLSYMGLSEGTGDCLLGMNPAEDTVENVIVVMETLDKIRRETGVPTQICCLAHIKTQLAALEKGAPVEILFQSIAGTDTTLIDEFDVTVDYLDKAYYTMAEKGPLRGQAEQWMYFETGQGSEVSYNKHNGIDMTVTEALCYGLARRYDPFMVNNVTGFIGPETHLDNFEMMISNLQDQFMGKLMGLPMGMAPCYTLHSNCTAEGQQMATQMLTAAGANFFMDVYYGMDRMLSYFDTSGHDNQTLREIHNLKPAPEYLAWAVEKGIYQVDEQGNVERGANWGNPRIFCDSDVEFQKLLESTPAMYGLENAGPRVANHVQRTLRANQAIAREAIHTDLRMEELAQFNVRVLHTKATSKDDHLNNPELGAHIAEQDLTTLQAEGCDVQVLISDGLSAEAIHHNMDELLPVLEDGLKSRGFTVGQHIVAPYGRVKLAEEVAETLQAKVIINLIGERPGGDALASRSMSSYMTYRLAGEEEKQAAAEFSGNSDISFEMTVISNIYAGGIPSLEAGSLIVERATEILENRAAGNRLTDLLRKKS
ncbi:MAG: ethanolamine ammonia-lyase [Desulfuromonadales bacterium C00003068]|jgi:ethanolamine ammonia-lyase large subunit|nr:MAG: ethanolamine ammonia-lyase [Desulfuromonadales bacterium C00003068]